MSARGDIALHQELVKVAEAKLAVSPETMKMLLAGGAGALGVGVPAALLTHAHDERQKAHAQNNAFGAGMATGIATPRILKGLFNIAHQRGFMDAPAPAMPMDGVA